jgi:hypothetical protein
MNYKLFLDESGDHGLGNIDSAFPVFVLCGIIVSDSNYETIKIEFNKIKNEFWNNTNVIFHSRDIRKCNNEFAILFDLEIKQCFYNKINAVIESSNYHIISSVINKEEFIKKFGKLASDVYEIALSIIIERSVLYLEEINDKNISFEIVLEKRGKKEDAQLSSHFQKLLNLGTGIVNPTILEKFNTKISFIDKKDNINGLQLADLVAYPIARYAINPKRVNLSFDILKPKFFTKNGKDLGIMYYP